MRQGRTRVNTRCERAVRNVRGTVVYCDSSLSFCTMLFVDSSVEAPIPRPLGMFHPRNLHPVHSLCCHPILTDTSCKVQDAMRQSESRTHQKILGRPVKSKVSKIIKQNGKAWPATDLPKKVKQSLQDSVRLWNIRCKKKYFTYYLNYLYVNAKNKSSAYKILPLSF